MLTKRIILILSLVIFWRISYTQTKELVSSRKDIYQPKGDYFYERYEYRRAIYFYNLSYKEDTNNFKVLLKMADAFSMLGLNWQSEEYYRKAFERNSAIDNEYLLKYGIILIANGKLEESKTWLEKYNQLVESDMRGKEYLASIDKRGELYKDSSILFVNNLKEINTKESEINPVTYNHEIIYAAIRNNVIDPVATSYYDLYSSSFSPTGKLIKTGFYNMNINSSLHDGPICICLATNELFVTRNIISSRDEINLGIFITKLPKNNNDEIILTPLTIPRFKYDMGHPAINANGTEIYFISDSPNGHGGTDIFKSTLVNEQWEYPENLGSEINTKGNEMFPFLFNDSVLYFASDGHGGLGGLDIFKVNLTRKPLRLINLGYPINSSSDDFSLFIESDGELGYYSSNRPDGAGSDDIYRIRFLNFKIKGSLFDAQSSTLIEDAKISLLFEDGKELSIAKSDNGNFEFSIIPGESYTLVIEKENYKAAEIFFDENMTLELREQMMIKLKPVQTNEIKLEAGQKYNFSFGNDSISPEIKKGLEDLLTGFKAGADSVSAITMLAKDLNISKDDNLSLHLIKNNFEDSPGITQQETLMLFDKDTLVVSDDSILISMPSDTKNNFSLQSDADFIKNEILAGENSFILDNEPILPDSGRIVSPDEEEALKALEWLMSLSINTSDTYKEDSTIKSITAKGFSIIPQSTYTLNVSKKDASGEQKEEMIIPLTKGVKYDFTSDTSTNEGYHATLDKFLDDRKDIKIDDAIAIDISLLSKELKVEKGDELTFNIVPDTNDITGKDEGTTIVLDNRSFDIRSDEKYIINVPYEEQQQVSIRTDIAHLQKNFAESIYNLDVDTIPFFSEIAIDTTGLRERYFKEITSKIISDEEGAIKELEWLMSLSINTTDTYNEDSTIKSITAKGFSIIPQSTYTLNVSKKDASGEQEEEIIVPLTKGVKYDFTSDTSANEGYHATLDKYLDDRKDIKIDDAIAIDISLLSKELKIEKGDELSFSIMPDTSDVIKKPQSTTIILDNKAFDIASNEKYVINVPYNKQQQLNISTDIDHLQKNFPNNSYNLNLDTIPFFSEITIDTTGLRERYFEEITAKINTDEEEALKELEWLMSLSINEGDTRRKDPVLNSITAKGFSIIPQSTYTLNVSKKDASGEQKEEMIIPLTKGVKYDFTSDTSANEGYHATLDKYLDDRKDIKIDNAIAIDISLLSKELKVEKGDELTFNIVPDTNDITGKDEGTTIVLDNRSFDIRSDEKYVIHVPYEQQQQVNIRTDIAHLHKNFADNSYTFDIDTIPFFSKGAIDTMEFFKREVEESTQVAKSEMRSLTDINPLNISYLVQIAAVRKTISIEEIKAIYKGNMNVRVFEEDGWYKYYIAETPTYFEAKIILDECEVKDAFIAAYESDKKISLKRAILRQYLESLASRGGSPIDSIVNVVMLNFEFNKYSLRKNDEKYIQELIVQEMNKNSDFYVVINGHTDIRGSSSYNYMLAEERADFVRDILIEKGIDKHRIKTFSFGEYQVLKACYTPDECDESIHQVNRRVEIILFAPKVSGKRE